MPNILIIDDDPVIRQFLVFQLNSIGYQPAVAATLSAGLQAVKSAEFDLVFLDVNLPDGSGLDAIETIKTTSSKPEVIIMTGEGNEKGAEMAFSHGVWDYILKPFTNYEINLQVERSLAFRESRKQSQSSETLIDRSEIIGSSPELMSRLNQVAQCAKTDANVLITGPTGTGKELFAKVIHINSNQDQDRFVVIDCAALPEQLVESVLFGHVKGAFTGADSKREGLVKQADGGTLFLDEIGELPMATQTKFLRVLQERKYKPVGGTNEITSDFRLIAATNRNLEEMVEKNSFRSDLLFRLKTFHINLPALRHYKTDIKDMILHFIYKLCCHHGFDNKGFEPDFLSALEAYDWPGNVRELISVLEIAILTDPVSQMLYPNHLPGNIRLNQIKTAINKKDRQGHSNGQAKREPAASGWGHFLNEPIQPLKVVKDLAMDEFVEVYLKKLMAVHKGNLEKTMNVSGLSKSHLYSLLKKYNIPKK